MKKIIYKANNGECQRVFFDFNEEFPEFGCSWIAVTENGLIMEQEDCECEYDSLFPSGRITNTLLTSKSASDEDLAYIRNLVDSWGTDSCKGMKLDCKSYRSNCVIFGKNMRHMIDFDTTSCYFPGGEFECDGQEEAVSQYISDLVEEISDHFPGAYNIKSTANIAARGQINRIYDAWASYDDDK